MAVEEPRARVVGPEPDRDIVIEHTGADHIANNRVIPVISRVASTTYNPEVMLYQNNCKSKALQQIQTLTPCKWNGCGPPGAVPDGNEIWIVLFSGSAYTDPDGMIS